MWKAEFAHALSFFRHDRRGSVGIIFGLAAVPLMMFIGASIDYNRAIVARSRLQQAVDHAVVAASAQPADKRASAATIAFDAWAPEQDGVTATASFQADATTYSGTATATVPTHFMGVARVYSLTVRASSTVSLSTTTGWGSCIVALGKGMPASAAALTLNGSPNLNLSGCYIQSNVSMVCNGHAAGATQSKAVGSVSGCSNPVPNSPAFLDPYADLASKITKFCSGVGSGVTWSAGTLPTSGNFIAVARSGYGEYHVCGDLTLKGGGALIAGGAVVIIENGDLIVDNNANVSASNTTFVLTGVNGVDHEIKFPNGNGKSATLTMQAPTGSAHPWRGMAIYSDPALTMDVDSDLGPGATLVFDGIIYMPNSDLTVRGVMTSSIAPCSSVIVDTFTSNGAPTLNFAQSETGCLGAGVARKLPPRLLL